VNTTTVQETRSVVKPWVLDLPWRKQSTLFSALRGPDDRTSMFYTDWRDVVRWLRGVVQKDACELEGLEGCTYMRKELDIPPVPLGRLGDHFHEHINAALRVVADHHPHSLIRHAAQTLTRV
jgi:hypothetical protein